MPRREMPQKFRTLIRYCENYIAFLYYRLHTHRHRPKTFTFGGGVYEYFNHVYNTTWRNERTVEVPIAWKQVKEEEGDILEVGNVLSHYYSTTHDVVDLYEKAPRVINEDVRTYDTPKGYDLIVCISTFEHVGGQKRLLEAFDNLNKLLKPKGKILITIPIGLNRELDRMLQLRMLPFAESTIMVRYSDLNLWKESDDLENLTADFDFRVPRANVIFVGEFLKQTVE